MQQYTDTHRLTPATSLKMKPRNDASSWHGVKENANPFYLFVGNLNSNPYSSENKIQNVLMFSVLETH